MLKDIVSPEILKILTNCSRTEYPCIYKNIIYKHYPWKKTLLILIGPTASGKSTFIEFLSRFYPRIITATTRTEKRSDESDESFVWMMDRIFPNESYEEYKSRLAEKYDLLESNIHAGNVYGTPRESIEKAFASDDVAIMSSENNGAKALLGKLNNDMNVCVIFVMPDSINQIRNRLGNTRNNIEERIIIAKREIEDSSNIANFYLHNTESQEYIRNNPLFYTEECIKEFIKLILR